MSIIKRMRRQTATYWAPAAGDDGCGGPSYEAPVLIKCRWVDKQELFRNENGEERVSSAVVSIDRELQVGGHLALGDATSQPEPSKLAESHPILAFQKIPNLRNTETLLKALI